MHFNGIEIDDLVKMGNQMVKAHRETESIMTAIDLFKEECPDADTETLAILWVGINCKDREHLNN